MTPLTPPPWCQGAATKLTASRPVRACIADSKLQPWQGHLCATHCILNTRLLALPVSVQVPLYPVPDYYREKAVLLLEADG